MASPQTIGTTVRKNLLRLAIESGMDEMVPESLIESGLEDLELGLGQILGDVIRADRRGISLGAAVHLHENFPYLARAHGLLSDALLSAVPAELLPWIERIRDMPTPTWTIEGRNALCVVARSSLARTEERALTRFILFEGIRLNIFLAARKTNGHLEGIGGCGRDLDDIASEQLSKLLEIPLIEDTLDEYRPFEVVVASAMERLLEFSGTLLASQIYVEEWRDAIADSIELERRLRQEDPRDAAILANKFSRAHHRQDIPVSRLSLEHPMLLGGYSEDAINQRSSRAIKTLSNPINTSIEGSGPLILADILIETLEIQDA